MCLKLLVSRPRWVSMSVDRPNVLVPGWITDAPAAGGAEGRLRADERVVGHVPTHAARAWGWVEEEGGEGSSADGPRLRSSHPHAARRCGDGCTPSRGQASRRTTVQLGLRGSRTARDLRWSPECGLAQGRSLNHNVQRTSAGFIDDTDRPSQGRSVSCRQDWRSSTAGLHHYVHENPRRSDGRCSCETAPGAHASSGLPGSEEILEIQQTRQMISAQDRHP